MSLQRPGLFWHPLAKAATLGLLEREAEGAGFVENLITLRPDFKERGCALIGYYVKFDENREQVIRGLSRCGLEIV